MMRFSQRVTALFGSAFALLSACQQAGPTKPVFHADENPVYLSEWNVLQVKSGSLHLSENVVPYDLNSALFSDYAHKLRTMWVPDGLRADYRAESTFDFPVGTIISKTFYYPVAKGADPHAVKVQRLPDETQARLLSGFDLSAVKLIETRLLVRREAGWAALPYVWNADQTQARLKRTGDIIEISLEGETGTQDFAYVVPNANQCAGCHATNATTREVSPIGPKARHLNKDYVYDDGPANQLSMWSELGILGGVPSLQDAGKAINWEDVSASLNDRARAYLDINCSHCHNAVGPADTSGLMLEPSSPGGAHLGVCKSPIAAGTGTGGHEFGIVPGQPERSILAFRMASTDPAAMMPELGRSIAHDEGVALIEDWIREMRGSCED